MLHVICRGTPRAVEKGISCLSSSAAARFAGEHQHHLTAGQLALSVANTSFNNTAWRSLSLPSQQPWLPLLILCCDQPVLTCAGPCCSCCALAVSGSCGVVWSLSASVPMSVAAYVCDGGLLGLMPLEPATGEPRHRKSHAALSAMAVADDQLWLLTAGEIPGNGGLYTNRE